MDFKYYYQNCYVEVYVGKLNYEVCLLYNPKLPNLLTNIYIPVFIIIGGVFMYLGYRKK
jgi:hypothetical protein